MPKIKASTTRNRQLMVRLNEIEYQKLEAYALSEQITVSEAMRMLIKQLPRKTDGD